MDTQDTGTSLTRPADLPYFMLTLQKLWAVRWVLPITTYAFRDMDKSELQASPLIPRRPDKRGFTVNHLEHN